MKAIETSVPAADLARMLGLECGMKIVNIEWKPAHEAAVVTIQLPNSAPHGFDVAEFGYVQRVPLRDVQTQSARLTEAIRTHLPYSERVSVARGANPVPDDVG